MSYLPITARRTRLFAGGSAESGFGRSVVLEVGAVLLHRADDLADRVGTESRRGVMVHSARRLNAVPAHSAPGTSKEKFLARRGQRQSGATTRTAPRRRARDADNEGILPVLARAVREVEAGAERGRVSPSTRTRF